MIPSKVGQGPPHTLIRILRVTTQRKSMLDTTKQLVVVRFLASLEYIQGQSPRLRIECVINLRARQEKRFCGKDQSATSPVYEVECEALTVNVLEVMLLQERWMRKRASDDRVLCQLIAYIRRAKTVPNTHKPGGTILVALGDGVYPFRHRLISKSRVFAFPRFVVEIGIRTIVLVLSMLPHRVLCCVSYTP